MRGVIPGTKEPGARTAVFGLHLARLEILHTEVFLDAGEVREELYTVLLHARGIDAQKMQDIGVVQLAARELEECPQMIEHVPGDFGQDQHIRPQLLESVIVVELAYVEFH